MFPPAKLLAISGGVDSIAWLFFQRGSLTVCPIHSKQLRMENVLRQTEFTTFCGEAELTVSWGMTLTIPWAAELMSELLVKMRTEEWPVVEEWYAACNEPCSGSLLLRPRHVTPSSV